MKQAPLTGILMIMGVFFWGTALAKVDGTTGVPLGGVGTGAVKFCSHNGNFAGAFYSPCGWSDFPALTNTQFQLFTDRAGSVLTSSKLTAVVTAGRADDDAIYPVQFANMGSTNGVSVRLTAFAPYDPAHLAHMCYPFAFFELKLVNTQTSSVTVAGALQTQTRSNPAIATGKGLYTSTDLVKLAIYASSDQTGATVSVGSDNGFFTSGVCSNAITGTTNRVAVKVTLAANDSGSIRFVFAWHNTDPSNNVKGQPTNTNGERYWYTNVASTAAAFADSGLVFFTELKTRAVELVTRMRASNFPDWMKEHTLNSLCNLTSNTAYAKDRRYCHTEGMFAIMGTMDQMWHGRMIMGMTVPDLTWQELEFWARNQKTNPVGQIHHDFGVEFNFCGWDDQAHADYRNVDNWVDLNCAFIIAVYETYIATGDRTRLDYFWPYLKKAAARILAQKVQYGNTTYPYTFASSDNSYDAGGDPNPFNASISSVAYKIMTIYSDIYKDTVLKKTFQNAFDTVQISFKKRYLTNNFPSGRISEGFMAGQWMAFYLRFGQLFAQTDIDYALGVLNTYYKPLTNGLGFAAGSYDEWSPYLVAHYGGLCLQTGRFPEWRALQYDWYERNSLNRNRVFNQPLSVPSKVTTPVYLATDFGTNSQYISVPVLWRNYYTALGYFRNKPTGELWLETHILPEMNTHTMTNGFFIAPEGNGTISFTESGTGFADQDIVFKSDNPIAITALYVRDKSTDPLVTVYVNNVQRTVTRIGMGYAKELKIDFAGTVDTAVVKVRYGAVSIARSGETFIRNVIPESGTYRNVSGTVSLPLVNARRPVSVVVYDCAGRVVGSKTVTKTSVDLQKDFGAAKGVYVVRVTPVN